MADRPAGARIPGSGDRRAGRRPRGHRGDALGRSRVEGAWRGARRRLCGRRRPLLRGR